MSLPVLVVFSLKVAEQEVRYLSFSGPQMQLRCGFDEGVHSDNARFTVEQAGDGLVHLRSCYDNGYWARPSRLEPWLTASAPEAVEDINNEGCTLFRTRMSAGNVVVGFVHVQSGMNVVMLPAADTYAYNLCVQLTAPTEFSFVDYESLTKTKLPRYIMFLGDNNKYMTAVTMVEDDDNKYMLKEFLGQEAVVYLGFPNENPTEQAVVFEVLYSKSGDIQLKSILYDKVFEVYVRFGNGVVLDYTSDAIIPSYQNTVFEVVLSSPPNTPEVGVALHNRGLDSYCYRIALTDGTSLIIARPTTPNDNSVWLRPRHSQRCRVNIESFRRPRLLSKSSYSTSRASFTNFRDTIHEMDYTHHYQDHIRTTFSSSIAFFNGPKAVFKGRMPFVNSTGKIEFSDNETEANAQWGIINITQLQKKHVVKVSMQPNGRTYVSFINKVATFELPFSYQQLDEFPFGGTLTQHLHDGVFTFQSVYDIETSEEFQPFINSRSDENLGVELEGEPGIFIQEVSDAKGSTNGDEFDQGSDAQDNPSLVSSAPVL